MSIQRVPSVPFAQIANAALRDSRLSFRARGLLAFVLSNTGEWNATLSWLLKQSEKEGRDAIQSALNELTVLGYREVVRESDGRGGIRTVSVWRHVPETPDSRPTISSTDDFPDRRESRARSEHHSLEHHYQEHHQDQDQPADAGANDDPAAWPIPIPPSAVPSKFDRFWHMYPRKAGKQAARKAFAKAVKEADAETVIGAAARFAADPNREDEFTPHPATWLNQGRWEDDPLPARAQRNKTTYSQQRQSEVETLAARYRMKEQGQERRELEA